MNPAALACWLALLASPVLIRRLAPGSVPLKLRITALWLPWCLAACAFLPLLVIWRLGAGGILIAVYLLPFGCMALGWPWGSGMVCAPSCHWRAPCACYLLHGASAT